MYQEDDEADSTRPLIRKSRTIHKENTRPSGRWSCNSVLLKLMGVRLSGKVDYGYVPAAGFDRLQCVSRLGTTDWQALHILSQI